MQTKFLIEFNVNSFHKTLEISLPMGQSGRGTAGAYAVMD